MVVVVVRTRAAHKQKIDPKMGGNLDPNSIMMQEKERGVDNHYMDARIYESAVKKNSGELEDRVMTTTTRMCWRICTSTSRM